MPAFLSEEERAVLSALVDARPLELWRPGRLGTGYWKWPLRAELDEAARIFAPLIRRSLAALEASGDAWDAYLLRYPPLSSVPPHRDPAAGPHRRLNALIEAGRGPRDSPEAGLLHLDGRAAPLALGDGLIFRPDLVEHAVAPVARRRLVWSVGALSSRAGAAG